MATAAVATNNCLRFSFADRRSSFTERESFSPDRRPSAPECRVSYKSDDKLRRRNSWRWSLKNVFTRPFQSQSGATPAGSFRDKDKIRKKMSSASAKNLPKDSVEARMRMAKLLRMWYTDVADSSDDSSDDEREWSVRDRTRSRSPRIVGDESSSSGDDEEWMEEGGVSDEQVSLYVSEGPSSSMDAEARDAVQRVPELGEPTRDDSDADSSSGLRALETGYEQPAQPANSDREVLTGAQNTINYASVIAPTQICDLERFVDNTKQTKHSSCEQCSSSAPNNIDTEREDFESSEAIFEVGVTRCGGWCVEGGGYFGQSKGGGSHRLSLPTPREMRVDDGSIECFFNDGLSARTAHKDSGQEELMKGTLDEDRPMGKDEGDDDQVQFSGEMEELFSRQDLNAIRRFLGMSLQQINANKVLEKDSAKRPQPAAVVSLGNLMECGNVHEGYPQMQTKEVLPDYPSTYNKNTENESTKEQKAESWELHCEFKGFGCPFPIMKGELDRKLTKPETKFAQLAMGTRSEFELEKHMKCNVGEHLKLVSQTANEQKDQLKHQRSLQEKQGTLIQELIGTVHNLKDIVQDQLRRNESQEKLILTLKDQLREQRKQNQRFEREISRQFQALDQLAPSPTIPSAAAATAELLWPVKNFRRRLRRVREGVVDDPLISEPFYTGQSGYKLSIWMYLNGRGKNLGSSVSVYARVMPGEHDTILHWPVRPSYTFTLFDQSEGEKENIVRTRTVNDIRREDGKHHGIDRPGGGDRSVIVGFDDFIAHDQLENRNYLVDDCFFLKLEAKLFS